MASTYREQKEKMRGVRRRLAYDALSRASRELLKNCDDEGALGLIYEMIAIVDRLEIKEYATPKDEPTNQPQGLPQGSEDEEQEPVEQADARRLENLET